MPIVREPRSVSDAAVLLLSLADDLPTTARHESDPPLAAVRVLKVRQAIQFIASWLFECGADSDPSSPFYLVADQVVPGWGQAVQRTMLSVGEGRTVTIQTVIDGSWLEGRDTRVRLFATLAFEESRRPGDFENGLLAGEVF